jgi:hypothetical protein
MAKSNVAQHKQHLKLLEKSIKEICDKHKEINDTISESWNMTMKLFVIADDLRTTRLEFEKAEGQ